MDDENKNNNNENSENSNKNKRIYVLGSILLVLIVFLIVGGIKFFRETKEAKEKMANEEYHNQPHNKYNAPVVYYKSDLERIVGVELRESEEEFEGYKCMKYWNNRTVPTKYDDLRFYVFKDEETAYKALEEIKKGGGFREVTDEGPNYIRGWLEGVVDADVEDYYYVNGNLLVMTTVTCVSEWPTNVDDDEDPVMGGGEEAEALIKLINDNF
jgi:hypothetical protein